MNLSFKDQQEQISAEIVSFRAWASVPRVWGYETGSGHFFMISVDASSCLFCFNFNMG